MKNLTTGIYARAAGSSFSSAIGGRLYKGKAPQGVTWPYVVFGVVVDVPINTFKDNIEQVLLQFSIFSSASSSTQIEDIFTKLKALYDDAYFNIPGNILVAMERRGLVPLVVPADVETGMGVYWQYNVDYNIIMQAGASPSPSASASPSLSPSSSLSPSASPSPSASESPSSSESHSPSAGG